MNVSIVLGALFIACQIATFPKLPSSLFQVHNKIKEDILFKIMNDLLSSSMGLCLLARNLPKVSAFFQLRKSSLTLVLGHRIERGEVGKAFFIIFFLFLFKCKELRLNVYIIILFTFWYSPFSFQGLLGGYISRSSIYEDYTFSFQIVQYFHQLQEVIIKIVDQHQHQIRSF